MAVELDRDLLFGIFALKMDLVDAGEFAESLRAWRADHGERLHELVVRTQHVCGDDHERIAEAVDAYLVASEVTLPDPEAAHPSAAVTSESTLPSEASLSIPSAPSDAEHDRRPESVSGHRDPAHPGGLPPACRYRQLRPLARGGLGAVFVAHDDELDRDVALKEIHQRLADKLNYRSRFTMEAEVTGSLEHPGVVPVYGYGVYPDGRPYYAMRLIRGDSLREAVDAHHRMGASSTAESESQDLALRKLLTRFVAVCNAVEYAHSRGVLHRDIKPDNIMLGPYGETLLVDWGLAKLLGRGERPLVKGAIDEPSLEPRSASWSAETRVGAAVGTPGYMSPEQAAGEKGTVGPASDVYSLGATLYTLLTGVRPVATEKLSEMLTEVQLGEIRRPRDIAPRTPVALEAICLKAMSPVADHRYPSARALADDVEAYLADAPVEAWKEPWHVRAGRWMRRHRSLVSGAAAATVVLLVSLTAGVALLAAANERERALKDEAVEQRDRAEKFFQVARDAVYDYSMAVVQDRRMKALGLEGLRRELLEAARQYYQQLAESEADAPSLREDRAQAMFQLGQITEEIGTAEDAAVLYQQAEQALAGLLGENPQAESKADLELRRGMCLVNLANHEWMSGETDSADKRLAEATELFRRLINEYPDVEDSRARLAQCLNNRASFDLQQSRLAAAETGFRQALEIRESLQKSSPDNAHLLYDLASNYHNLDVIYRRKEEWANARDALDKAIAVSRHLVELDESDPYHKLSLAISERKLGELAFDQLEFREAVATLGRSLPIFEELVRVHPLVRLFRRELARCHSDLAIVHASAGEAKAAHYFRQAKSDCEELLAHDPTSVEDRTLLAKVLADFANFETSQDETKVADELLRQAIAVRRSLADQYPNLPVHRTELAMALLLQSRVADAAGDLTVAEELAREAVAQYEALRSEFGEVPQSPRELPAALNDLATVLSKQEKLEEAKAAYDRALALRRELAARHPENANYRNDCVASLISRGYFSLMLEDYDAADEYFDEAIQFGEQLLAENPEFDEGRRFLVLSRRLRGEAKTETGRFAEAIEDFDRALELGAGAQEPAIRQRRILCWISVGKHTDAITDIDALRQVFADSPSAASAFYAVEVAATAAEGVSVLKEHPLDEPARQNETTDKYRSLAVALLAVAREGGYFGDPANVASLKNDVRFTGLHGYEPYEELLRQLTEMNSTQ